jgi:hypothetical protein
VFKQLRRSKRAQFVYFIVTVIVGWFKMQIKSDH